jgi:hypothetical protein
MIPLLGIVSDFLHDPRPSFAQGRNSFLALQAIQIAEFFGRKVSIIIH